MDVILEKNVETNSNICKRFLLEVATRTPLPLLAVIRFSKNFLILYNPCFKLAFVYLFNNLLKVDIFTKIQYLYIHENNRNNWLIKSTIQFKKTTTNMIKTKGKEKKRVKQVVAYQKINYTKPTLKTCVRHRR